MALDLWAGPITTREATPPFSLKKNKSKRLHKSYDVLGLAREANGVARMWLPLEGSSSSDFEDRSSEGDFAAGRRAKQWR